MILYKRNFKKEIPKNCSEDLALHVYQYNKFDKRYYYCKCIEFIFESDYLVIGSFVTKQMAGVVNCKLYVYV